MAFRKRGLQDAEWASLGELNPGMGSRRLRLATARRDAAAQPAFIRLLPAKIAATLPVLRRAELALAGQGRGLARRPMRIPDDAMVQVRTSLAEQGPLRLAPPASAVNIPPQTKRPLGRRVLREGFTLALLLVTLMVTYYMGRFHAYQNVIVVPEPWSRQSGLS